MKLSNYILDLGRTVAYHPNLKKVTRSTTATIMLCQFLYWTNKTKDGWIWKVADEIEEETGLTENEQRTAKNVLIDLGLLEYEFKRLDHMSRYRINQDKLNEMWEELGGKSEATPERVEVVTPEPEKPKKKGDYIDYLMSPEALAAQIKIDRLVEIREEIEKKLHVNADNAKWVKFIEYAYKQEVQENRPASIFLDWAVKNNFSVIYWTPEKMITMYPEAYVDDAQNKPLEDFVEKLPEMKEKVVAPMPKSIGRHFMDEFET